MNKFHLLCNIKAKQSNVTCKNTERDTGLMLSTFMLSSLCWREKVFFGTPHHCSHIYKNSRHSGLFTWIVATEVVGPHVVMTPRKRECNKLCKRNRRRRRGDCGDCAALATRCVHVVQGRRSFTGRSQPPATRQTAATDSAPKSLESISGIMYEVKRWQSVFCSCYHHHLGNIIREPLERQLEKVSYIF